MKILYAVQGTGNGHINRALSFIPILKQYGELDIFISGRNSHISLNYPIKYLSDGVSFVYGNKGDVSYWRTLKNLNIQRLMREVDDFPVEKYDVVFNDFEPITAYACRKKNKHCVSLSHQAAFLSNKTPRPSGWAPIAELVLKRFAPCSYKLGFHYKPYDTFIKTPVVRQEIQDAQLSNQGHYTVYLSHYHPDHIIQCLNVYQDLRFHIFTQHVKQHEVRGHVELYPISPQTLTKSIASCTGIVTGAGFGLTSEALFLGKKLFVVPIQNQYEQACNLAALRNMGVHSCKSLAEGESFSNEFDQWLNTDSAVQLEFTNHYEETIEEVFDILFT